MTTYRDCCGTLRGMVAHQSAREQPCGWCLQAEAAARLAAESVPHRGLRGGVLGPVSPEQAKANARVLEAEVEEFERGRGARNVVPYRPRSAA